MNSPILQNLVLTFQRIKIPSKMTKLVYLIILFISIKLKNLTTASITPPIVQNCPKKCLCRRESNDDTEYEFRTLSVQCNTTTNIPENDKSIIERIKIEGNFSTFPTNLLKPQCYYENINFLTIRYTFIKDLRASDFSCLKNLMVIEVFKSEITKVENVFSNLVQLDSLYLLENKIKDVDKNAFRNLKLHRLVLSNNLITEISEDTLFPHDIHKLDLSLNKIKSNFEI